MRSRTRHPGGKYMRLRGKGQEPTSKTFELTLTVERAEVAGANMRANSITSNSGNVKEQEHEKGRSPGQHVPGKRAGIYTFLPIGECRNESARSLAGRGGTKDASEEPDAMAASGPGTRPGGRAASGRQDLNLRPPDPEPGALPD